MTDRDPGPTAAKKMRPNGRLALGLMLIGTGRAAGFAQFGASTEAFLASLAPWLGLLVVLAGAIAWSGRPGLGLAFFLVALCNLLAPSVIADAFCRVWDRRQHWALYANVLNCAQWLILVVIVLLLPLATLAVAAGLSQDSTVRLMMATLVAYVMWFHWFAARHVLQVSPARALVVMLGVLFGTALLVHLPAALAGSGRLDSLTAPAAVTRGGAP